MDWGDYMDYEDSVSKPGKASKAKVRADMVRNIVVAVGSGDGELQIWNPLQANETEQYIATSGMFDYMLLICFPSV